MRLLALLSALVCGMALLAGGLPAVAALLIAAAPVALLAALP